MKVLQNDLQNIHFWEVMKRKAKKVRFFVHISCICLLHVYSMYIVGICFFIYFILNTSTKVEMGFRLTVGTVWNLQRKECSNELSTAAHQISCAFYPKNPVLSSLLIFGICLAIRRTKYTSKMAWPWPSKNVFHPIL